jgi:hypothetical protein
MDKEAVIVALFLASAVTALIAAVREDWIPKVNKLALAVCFAASAFFLQVSNFFK